MSSTTAAGSAPGATPILAHRQILFIIFGLMAGMFLSALDQTVVGTSMRTIADDLHGLSIQAWVTTAYLITSTVSTPIYGKLSDIFGRRPLFIIAITIFMAGSLAAGFANSMYFLAVTRAVQGLGAGGLMALPLAIMGDILAPRERARYQGYFLAVFGISSVAGPLIGGLFAGADQILGIDGWRWVFLINIPVGIVALFMVFRFLHIPHTKRKVKIDWAGATTIIIALVPLLIVAEQGRVWGWSSPGAIACYVIGGLGIIAFIVSEKLAGESALIPLKLFRSPTFSMATILGVLVGFGMFGAMMTLPLYLQLVKGSTPTESGFQLLPMILGLMISSIASGQIIARTGRYKIFPILGTAFMSAGFLWLTFVTIDKSIWYLMGGMLLIGLGLGQMMQTLTIASQNSVQARDMGVATSSSTFFRQIGGTLGVAILFSVLFTAIPTQIQTSLKDTDTLTSAIDAALDPAVAQAPENAQIMKTIYDPIVQPIIASLPPGVDLSNDQARGQVVDAAVPQIQKALESGSGSGKATSALDGDTSFLNGADPRLSAPFLTGFSDSAVLVYWVAFFVVLLAFILSFFLKATPLRKKSALQEAEDARVEALAEGDTRSEADEAAADLELELIATRAAELTGALIEPGTGSIKTVHVDPDGPDQKG